MTYARVRDVKTQLERTVTVKAYQLIPKRYELLGYEDENGNQVDGPAAKVVSVKKKEGADPVVSKEIKRMTPAEIEAKKAELKALNEAAFEKARKEQEAKEAASKAEPEVKERKKPGPKPKNNAQV